MEQQRQLEQQKQTQQGEQAQPTGGEEQAKQTLTDLFESTRNDIVVALMANARAESQQVRKLASQMVRDHQKLDDRIVSYALKQKIELEPEAKMPEQVEELRDVEAAEFDRRFLDALASNHQQRMEELTNQVEQTEDKQLKPILKEAQKTLQRHMQQTQRVQKQIGGMAAG
jgi:putative membrane protein